MPSSGDVERTPLLDQRAGDEPRPRHDDEDADVEHAIVEEPDNAHPRKKRRVVQSSDKKFVCQAAGCGRKYGRAEHLYRHEQNHNPEPKYWCDHPGCTKDGFHRADLLTRHKERHTAKGSHLQRKDAFKTKSTADASVSAPSSPTSRHTVSASPVEPVQPSYQQNPQNEYYTPSIPSQQSVHVQSHEYQSHPTARIPATNGHLRSSLDPQLSNAGANAVLPAINGSYDNTSMMPPATIPERRFSYDGSYTSRPQSNHETYAQTHQQYEPQTPLQSLPASSTHSMGTAYMQNPTYQSSSSTAYRSPTMHQALPPLPPFGFQSNYGTQASDRGSILSPPNMTSANQNTYSTGRSDSFTTFNMMDMGGAPYTLPVFNDEYGLNRSPPLALNVDFFDSLLLGTSGMMPDSIIPSPPGPENTNMQSVYSMPLPKIEPDSTPNNKVTFKQERLSPPAPANPETAMKESAVSEKKRVRLINLINARFTDSEHLPDRRPRDAIMNGCMDDPKHVMSLNMQRTFLASYWAHVHQQMPILHRPTFNPETCPDLLLLAMMCLGASCLEPGYALELTQRCAELSSFIAYHVRWEVFKDVEFRPTAKLWTFQTMLLLELFEKMYSTRTLHERAHIHHATTLTVMRRGSSLIGRSAIESPGHSNDPTRTPPGPDGSINTSGVNTPDAAWNRWITAEATRRTAFAAFIIDSTHATLFGHSAVMAPHDIKLPLPCDEALWAATSMNEVQRVEASLAAHGIKPIPFLEGLRHTLNGIKVPTHTFGRVILMAGLLNVSWHMNQRDLQVQSLGVNSAIGNSMKWRSPLTRAFDHWRRDFDISLAENDESLQTLRSDSASATPEHSSSMTRDSVFESRTCLHSLAHMAMHVDMIDCTVFAGSERALGRAVTEADRAAVQKRMRGTWAPSARARDAVFYALRFLREVLTPEERHHQASTSTTAPPITAPKFAYSARDDYLLNRPWVLYFAALIVWAYGYALDGPVRQPSSTHHSLSNSRDSQILDMRHYLSRVGGVKSPDDLETLKDRNECLGLLMLLRTCFREPRWELMHDASEIMDKCVGLLMGQGQAGLTGQEMDAKMRV